MVKNINISRDWLNMFTKACERFHLVFFVKMGKTSKDLAARTARNIRSNYLRGIEKSKRRQAYFISEYIQIKYFQLYSEAANFYNALNTLHPKKHDLRKVIEFTNWKSAINGENRRKRRSRQYENIEQLSDAEPQQSPEDIQQLSDSEPQQSPENIEQLSDSEPQQSPENIEQLSDSEPQQSPENIEQPSDAEPQQSPENIEQPSDSDPRQSPENIEQPSDSDPRQSPENIEQLSDSEPRQSPEVHTDRMRLEIPLMNYRAPNTKSPSSQQQTPTIHTQTVEMVTTEIVSQSEIENGLLNQLTAERIDEIINELRSDPELQDVFAEVDRAVQQEEAEIDEGIYIDNIGANLEIELDIDNRLEAELLNW